MKKLLSDRGHPLVIDAGSGAARMGGHSCGRACCYVYVDVGKSATLISDTDAARAADHTEKLVAE